VRLVATRAVARHDWRLLRADPVFLVVMIVMPLIVMAFLRPVFRATLVEGGAGDANGAEQVVPGVSVLFALFLVGNVGFSVFREHGWHTWERLRATPASGASLMVGKSVVPLASLGIQQVFLLGVGGLLLDLHVRGSLFGLVLVAASWAASLIGLGYLLLAVCRTIMQLNAINQLGTMVLAGLGGAITPITALPDWARTIAPLVPSYWAMRGYRSVILDAGGLADVALPVVVLLAFTAAFSLLAWWRFESTEAKTFFA
jgi:ABC-2 type transport system permease protein